MSELKYANSEITGFGSHSAAEVEQLQKALGLGGQGGVNIEGGGSIVDPGGSYASQVPGKFSGGNALAVEDLDRTLKLVTFGLEHLRLWKDILKERVPQVVHEYNIQNAYGLSDASPFFEMGQTPAETDAQYNRDVVQIKYLGTKGAVLHNLTLIQAAHGPVVAREVKNKTIELLARNERAMFDASSRLSQGIEYDGIDTQIREKSGFGGLTQNPASDHPNVSAYESAAFTAYGNTSGNIILDAGGADFDEDLAEDAALVAVNNFGMPMDMYLGTDIHSAFSRAFYAKQRTVPGESLTSGNRVTEHMGTLDYRFKPSLFNRPRKNAVKTSASSYNASTGTAGNDVFSIAVSTGAGIVGNTANYKIAGVFADGESDLSIAVAGLNVGTVDIDITAGSNLIVPSGLLYFNVYKENASAPGTDKFLFLLRTTAFGVNTATRRAGFVAASGVGGAGKAYLLMHDPDVLCWKQLGSMIKYDLAVTTTQYEWLQLLYGTPLIMAPFKNVIIDNIKSGV